MENTTLYYHLMFKKSNHSNSFGLSLINALVGITMITIAGLGIYALFSFTLKILGENRSRTTATEVANEKMELIRNLSYPDIGTIGGVPSGAIPQNEAIIRNSIFFNVNTQIFYVDDPFDGLQGGDPNDTLNTDYKRVKITISWPGVSFSKPVIVSTLVAPMGIETTTGGGTLKITVFNANGEFVPEAFVHLENDALEPAISIDSQTNSLGTLLVPGALPNQETYEITVTKSGYSTDKTYPITIELPVPTKPQASVIEGEVTEISFAIDQTSTLVINTISKNYPLNFKVNTDETALDQSLPKITVDNAGYYYFVWQDYRSGSSPRIYAQKYSSNKIRQWPEDKQVSTPVNMVNPAITTDGANIYIAWNDNRNGNQDSYLIKFDSSGNELWEGDKKIDVTSQSADQIVPALNAATSTGDSYIAFQDNRSGNWDIYAHRYDTNGNAIWAQEIKINTDSANADQYNPAIGLDADNNIYISWQDNREGNYNIYLHKFDPDGNALWANEIRVNTDVSSEISHLAPQIALDSNSNIYLAWADNRADNYDIYLHEYNPDSTPAWPAEIKINTDTTIADQTSPALTIDDSSNIYIAWTDARNNHNDIYSQKCDSEGNPLWTNDERVNMDFGSADQGGAALMTDQDSGAVFVWHDNRDGDYNIYAAKYQGPGTIVPLSSVPLTVVGAKTIYTTPLIYKYDNNHSTDAAGELTLPNMEWDSYTITPQATSSYTLISSEPGQPINLAPASVVNVTLNLE